VKTNTHIEVALGFLDQPIAQAASGVFLGAGDLDLLCVAARYRRHNDHGRSRSWADNGEFVGNVAQWQDRAMPEWDRGGNAIKALAHPRKAAGDKAVCFVQIGVPWYRQVDCAPRTADAKRQATCCRMASNLDRCWKPFDFQQLNGGRCLG
jgi:hypothetical protein